MRNWLMGKCRYSKHAAQYKCVKSAHISLAVYTVYQHTRSPPSGEICIRYTIDALSELRKEIENFSQDNVDAIIVSSVVLAGAADDWEQWLVFVDGYAKALSFIKGHKVETTCPEPLGEDFQLRSFMMQSNNSAPSTSWPAMQQRMQSFITSVMILNNAIGLQSWRSIGFEDLEQLARIVDATLSLESESEVFHKLAWLRSWMFWIELRRPNESDEQQVLTCYFYALVLAVVPLFPAKYSESLMRVCAGRIEGVLQGLSEEVVDGYRLLELASV
ncbi:hypothetical protein LSUE1_G009769 [Lachnellula suecica]|uniref:Uncharacterized protein n=1 Tax=Lachnellula suecica TaxID=602035 RepID=A0A8T9BXF1_9HELO|nr:hypothetical protein LSUE1_G009769 [Lachnellula suecica]